MSVQSLTFAGFRNYTEKRTIPIAPHTTLVVGQNAAGKTNLLEAIYVSQYAKSFRHAQFSDLFGYTSDTFSIELLEDDETRSLFVASKQGTGGKSFFINGVKKTMTEYKSRTHGAVVFQPEDVALITGAPADRRDYLDSFLMVHDRSYAHAKANYEHGLFKRNKLLADTVGFSDTFFRLLSQYDAFLIPHAAVMQAVRERFIAFCNENAVFAETTFELHYEKDSFTTENSQWHRTDDMRYRRTSFGPQRDDIAIHKVINGVGKNVAAFGARSEQRLAVLWLKAMELQFIEDVYKKNPLCLLDDVFSELDQENSKRVMEITKGRQTIITTADKDVVPIVKSKIGAIVNL